MKKNDRNTCPYGSYKFMPACSKNHLQVHEQYFCLVFHFCTNSGLNET